MPALNWSLFLGLSGDARYNFELACRGAIHRTYAHYGSFRARANQPGVEFHLRLTMDCEALGGIGRWWGWQCKWYEIPPGRALGTTRRDSIEDAIRKTEEHVSGVTDWVLWTRHSLTTGDQTWFYGLRSEMRLHLWTEDELANLLVGDAAVLRSAFFGELVLDPHLLAQRHEEAVGPVRHRWLKEVHQELEVEKSVRKMLGGAGSWEDLECHIAQLNADSEALVRGPSAPAPFDDAVAEVASTSADTAAVLDDILAAVRSGDLHALELVSAPLLPKLGLDVRRRVSKLRASGSLLAPLVHNCLDSLRSTPEFIYDIEATFGEQLVAVVAPAGCGKTQLAIELTNGTDHRPPGVLLHGSKLARGDSLDSLATRFRVAARPVASMEELIAAVDAAGQRHRCRLPIVIDALNESEDPRDWLGELSSLQLVLRRYPQVLLVCTLRPEFEEDCLPARVRTLEITGFEGHETEAIRAYFKHFKLDIGEATIPWDLLSHPLTLRLYCEVANPDRKGMVSVDKMPGSLSSLFDEYLRQAASRIAELSRQPHRLYQHDVTKALGLLGHELWNRRSRAIDVDELRALLKDDERTWDHSIVHALEQEGVLHRVATTASGSFTAPAYDALGGHIMARRIVVEHSQSTLTDWLAAPSIIASLAGPYDERHPLSSDFLRALASVVPRHFQDKQLWMLAPESLRREALILATRSEASLLDAETVAELRELLGTDSRAATTTLERLFELRGAVDHPLNANFLDALLRPMSVAERDLFWTEWLRRNHEWVRSDLEALTRRWKGGSGRGAPLRAWWVAWTLTSNVVGIRYAASQALHHLGRRQPDLVFDVCLQALDLNDDYVVERLLAVSYGICMAHREHSESFEEALRTLLEGLDCALLGPDATSPTWHWLARMYVRDMFRFAEAFYAAAIPAGIDPTEALTFAPGPPMPELEEGTAEGDEADRALGFNYRNYTVGRLNPSRHNYDDSHQGHRDALAAIRGVVWQLGWRREPFATIDGRISESAYRRYSHLPPTERYGKKYCWSGFYRHAGRLVAEGHLQSSERLSDLGLDPSFPRRPENDPDPWPSLGWVGTEAMDTRTWLRSGDLVLPAGVARRETIGDADGPWLAVYAHLEARDEVLGRRTTFALGAVLVKPEDAAPLVKGLRNGSASGWDLRQIPAEFRTFAGEIPWSSRFSGQADGLYRDMVWIKDNEEIEVEKLAHHYQWEWEGGPADQNDASGTVFASGALSRFHNLLGRLDTFDQFLPDGKPASVVLRPPGTLEGQILYVREDLLKAYADGREVVFHIWGERQPAKYPFPPPEWLRELSVAHENETRITQSGEDMGFAW